MWPIGCVWLMEIDFCPRQLQFWSNFSEILDLGPINDDNSTDVRVFGGDEVPSNNAIAGIG